MKNTFVALALFICTVSIAEKSTDPRFIKQHQQLNFTENKGQFADQNNIPRTDILFGGTDGEITFHITNKGISYQLYRIESTKELVDHKIKRKRTTIDKQTIYRTDIKWLNANPDPTIKTDDAVDGHTNYYSDQCPNGALNVKSYKGFTLKNIYKNVNLHYYEKEGRLKYDYIVAPYAGYKQIQLKVEGAILKLQKDGSLLIETPLGKIQEHTPIVYQNGKQLNAHYSVQNNTISFEIENYDPKYKLIIDPLIRLWGTYYGGTGADLGNFCSVDSAGNVYLSGHAANSTSTIIATTGGHQTLYGGGTQDVFLAKFNSNGARQWGTYYGGTGSLENGYSNCVDRNGNVYLSGATNSTLTNVISTAGCHQSTYGGGVHDAFLVKFNSSGVRIWGTYYGGNADDQGYSCTTDTSGNVYLAGGTGSGTLIASPGSHQTFNGGGTTDGFLAKFDSLGNRIWGTFYGGSFDDYVNSCSIDPVGDIYICGLGRSSSANVISTPGCHQISPGGGGEEAFLAKFNTNGIRQWGTYYGGIGDEISYSCVTDKVGNVFMTGYTNTNTGTVIATSGSHQTTSGGGPRDAFLVKFNSAGVRQWGTYYGGSGGDYGYVCATDKTGNIYMVGMSGTSTGTVIATPGSQQLIHGGLNDMMLVKFNSGGTRIDGTYYGGTGQDVGNGCAIDTSGYIYVSGYTPTNTGTVMATSGSHQSSYGGGSNDAYLVKFMFCNAPPAPANITLSSNQFICDGSVTTLSVSSSPTVNWYSSSSSTVSLTSGNSFATPVLSTGTYSYYAETTNTCSISGRTIITITVNPLPIITVNSGSICSGNSFTISPSGANTYTIEGGSAIVSPTITSSYTVAGASTAGCVSAIIAISDVTVHTAPVIIANSGSICSGDSFTITPSGANTYTIEGGNAIVSPTTTTSYTVSGTDTLGCVSNNLASSNITVNPLPLISAVSSHTNFVCSGESATLTASGANTYTWNPGGSGSNIIISPTITTTYSFTGTDINGCVNSSAFTQSVSACPGIREFGLNNPMINIYPNPSTGEFIILLNSINENVEIEICNTIGQVILSRSLTGLQTKINLIDKTAGIYFIRIGSVTKKLIITD